MRERGTEGLPDNDLADGEGASTMGKRVVTIILLVIIAIVFVVMIRLYGFADFPVAPWVFLMFCLGIIYRAVLKRIEGEKPQVDSVTGVPNSSNVTGSPPVPMASPILSRSAKSSRLLEPVDSSALLEIARIISHDDEDLLCELQECMKDPGRFLDGTLDSYDAGDDLLDKASISRTVCWDFLLEQLIDFDYAAALDWKLEPEDVIFNIELLLEKDQESLDFSAAEEDADSDVETTLYRVSSMLENQPILLGQLEFDADSLVVFLTEATEKETLITLAEEYGKYILFDFSPDSGES
jgi:hypothetical protein